MVQGLLEFDALAIILEVYHESAFYYRNNVFIRHAAVGSEALYPIQIWGAVRLSLRYRTADGAIFRCACVDISLSQYIGITAFPSNLVFFKTFLFLWF